MSNLHKLKRFTLLSIMSFVLLFTTVKVYAPSDDAWAGLWTYKNTIIVEYSNELNNYYSSNDDNTQIHYTSTSTKVDYRFNYTGSGYQEDLYEAALKDPETYQYETIILSGEYAYSELNFSMPNIQYRENVIINIDTSGELYDYKLFHFDNIEFYTLVWTHIYNPGEIIINENKDIQNTSRISNRLEPLLYKVASDEKLYNFTGTFTGYTPYGINNGDIMTIEINIGFNPFTSLNLYASHSQTEYGYDNIKIYHVYTWKYGTTGIITDSNALDFPGEDNGINIPIIILTGILGTSAALAALSSQYKEDPKSKFKLYIQKDFGSAIRYNKPPVTVYARIAEIKEDGSEIDRLDLTENIKITSGGAPIDIGDTAVSSNYKGALVSAQATERQDNPVEGIVTFTYTGEGGYFQNDLKFRLVGKPYIEHERIEKGSGTVLVNMILGDSLTYELYFKPMDFVDIPEVTILGEDEVYATLEKIDEQGYKAILVNKSITGDTKKQVTIQIKSETENELAESEIVVVLYPEGISVDATFDDQKHLIVRTEENEDGSVLDPKIKPTRLKVTLAILDQTSSKPKAIICDMKEVDIVIDNLTGEDSIAQNLKSTFKYQVNTELKDEGIFYIEPQVTLPELEDAKPYILQTSIHCSYKGETYDKSITIKLIGEKPTPLDNWDEEHRLLIRAIQRYGLSSNGHAKELIRSAKHRTATELCMIRRAIIMESAYYYTKEGQEFRDLEEKLAKLEFVFSVIKWFGDQAFSYLVTFYGPGAMADAFLSPLKDYVTELIGEIGAKIYWGEEINFKAVNLFAAIESGIENTIINIITGDEPPTPKKIGVLVASFVMLNFTKHYTITEDSKGDFYKTLINMCGDITVNSLKALASKHMGEYFKNNPQFKDKINQWLGTYLSNQVDSINHFDVLIKYAEETIGLIIAQSYADGIKRVEQIASGELAIKVGTGVIVIRIIENLDAISNFFFKQFMSMIEIPKDKPPKPTTPPYIRA